MRRVVAGAVVLMVSGCGSTKPQPSPQPSPRDPGQCATAIDMLPEPPGTLEIVLGVVALPTRRLLQANDVGHAGELFAKQGLVVKADAEVELAVGAERERCAAGVEWGRHDRPDHPPPAVHRANRLVCVRGRVLRGRADLPAGGGAGGRAGADRANRGRCRVLNAVRSARHR